jgi:hypothetical protein
MHYELYQSEEILTSQILRTGKFGKHWERWRALISRDGDDHGDDEESEGR